MSELEKFGSDPFDDMVNREAEITDILVIRENPNMAVGQMAERPGMSNRTPEREISDMKNKRPRRIGSQKSGYPNIIEQW